MEAETTPGMTRRRNAIRALLESAPHSVTEMVMATGFADPRSYIRYLRKYGVAVADEWKTTPDGSRYKVYSIPNPTR